MSPRSEGADLEEIEAVYRRRLAEFRRVATAITGSRELALDAVQEAFARAIRLRRGFRGESSLDGWVWRIVVNTARDAAAAGALRPQSDPDAFVRNGDRPVPAPEADRARELVRALPERQRLALFLRYYADLDYATIAGALEISTGTVGATLAQGRESLRKLLGEVRS